MDDALVEYMRTAVDLERFRQSSADNPVKPRINSQWDTDKCQALTVSLLHNQVASGAYMRPQAPSSQVLAKQVAAQLKAVRYGMFRLETMMHERDANQGSSKAHAYRRESSMRKWATRKQEEHEIHMRKAESIQTVGIFLFTSSFLPDAQNH